MTPVPPMAHSLSDGEIDGHPCGTRLLSFRGPGAGKPMFGALSSRCEVGVGVLALPEELAALLGPDTPARLKSVLLLWRYPPASRQFDRQRICIWRR